MVSARFKRRTSRFSFRLLCGKRDARGCQSCRGELGTLVTKADDVTRSYVMAHPLVNAAMALDAASGAYRLSRRRRPFLSGTEGGRRIGAGISQGATAHLLRDPDGQPLKWLDGLYDRAGHDQLMIVCPRCSTANEVTMRQFMEALVDVGVLIVAPS